MDIDHLIQQIQAATPPPDIHTKIVSIDGYGGAGKSTLAQTLAVALPATVVHTDDFADGSAADWRPRLLQQLLQPLSVNTPGNYQRYDWDAGQLADWHQVAPGGIVLLEGVRSSSLLFRLFLAYHIWVDTDLDLCLQRGLQRDGQDALSQWQQWQTREQAYVQREQPQLVADYIVRGQ